MDKRRTIRIDSSSPFWGQLEKIQKKRNEN
jgi:hypothetical protein